MERERIVYEIREADGRVSAATFDKAQAEEWAITGGTVKPDAVPTLLSATGAWMKLDSLERLCWGSAEAGDTIVHLVVAMPGGVDGRDHTARGGQVRYASTDRDLAEQARDGWSEVRAKVVVPAEIAARAAAKLCAVHRLCLGEHVEELRARTERALTGSRPAAAAPRR